MWLALLRLFTTPLQPFAYFYLCGLFGHLGSQWADLQDFITPLQPFGHSRLAAVAFVASGWVLKALCLQAHWGLFVGLSGRSGGLQSSQGGQVVRMVGFWFLGGMWAGGQVCYLSWPCMWADGQVYVWA